MRAGLRKEGLPAYTWAAVLRLFSRCFCFNITLSLLLHSFVCLTSSLWLLVPSFSSTDIHCTLVHLFLHMCNGPPKILVSKFVVLVNSFMYICMFAVYMSSWACLLYTCAAQNPRFLSIFSRDLLTPHPLACLPYLPYISQDLHHWASGLPGRS